MVFERLAVNGVDFAVFAHAFEKALAALVAEPAALNHFENERLHFEAFAVRVMFGRVVKVLRDVRPNVNANDVEQSVTGALRQTDQRTGERIHFLNREVMLNRQALNR